MTSITLSNKWGAAIDMRSSLKSKYHSHGSMTTWVRATLLRALPCAIGLLALAPHSKAASRWPPFVENVIASSIKVCGGKYIQDPGFVSLKDVNGDGVKDYLIDYQKFACKTEDGKRNPAYWCGTAGCEFDIFASRRGTFVKVEIPNAIEVDFRRRHGASVVDFYVKEGPRAEKGTWRWDGTTFAPTDSK